MLLHIVVALGHQPPAGGEVGDVSLYACDAARVDALQQPFDLVAAGVPELDVASAARPPPVGAVDAAVLFQDAYALVDLVHAGPDAWVVVEAGAHADGSLTHALVDERLDRLKLLVRAVALVVVAHDVDPAGPLAHEGRGVHGYAYLLHLVHPLAKGVPVHLPAVVPLHQLVHVLTGEDLVLGVVLVGLQLVDVLTGYARQPHHLAEGPLAAAALAAHEGGDPLHYVALGLGEEEEGGVPVAVGVYPAR